MVTEIAPAVAPPPVARHGGRPHLLRVILKDRIGAVGVVIVVVMTLAAVFAPVLAPYDPTAMSSQRLAPPSGTFLLGATRPVATCSAGRSTARGHR